MNEPWRDKIEDLISNMTYEYVIQERDIGQGNHSIVYRKFVSAINMGRRLTSN